MNAHWETIAGVSCLVGEGRCVGCRTVLTLVALPTARFQHDDVVCFRCGPAVRKG
jgi:hypothetical protein